MVRLTWPGGQNMELDGRLVTRIRKAIPAEDGDSGGNTRIDWIVPEFVEEQPAEVAALVSAELATLTSLRMQGGDPVWFNGEKAAGPHYVIPQHRTGGVRSAVIFASKRQLVSNTPEEVVEVIRAARGVVMTVRRDLEGAVEAAEGIAVQVENWDPHLF